MKVLGFIASHYVGSFGKECLLSIRDHCDKVYICHSTGASQGFNTELPPPETSTEIYNLAKELLGDKLIWEEYPSFPNESEHRRMRYRHTAGFDYCLVTDWDEVMQNIPEALEYVRNHPERFYGAAGFKHFWRGNEYFFEDHHRPIRIEKLTVANLDENLNLPLEVFHYSLCVSPEIMQYKLQVSGHKNEFRPDFYDKWTNWTLEKIDEITDLHPTLPGLWMKPTKYTGELPKFIKNYKSKPTMINVLYIPIDYHRHSETLDLFQDVINSINLVANCKIYSGDIQDAIRFKPTVILFQGSASVYELIQIKENTGSLIIMFTGDCRYFPTQSLINYKEVVDVYLLPFSGTLLNTYQTLLGKPCHFLWESIQNWRFMPPKMMDETSGAEIVFVGNKYKDLPGIEARNELEGFISEQSPYPIELYGSGFRGGEVPNTSVPNIYNKAYAVIAENNFSVENYFTPRNIGGMAAGSCVLMKYFPGIERFFQNNFHCLYYRDKYELLELISMIKLNPNIRNNIASQGFGLVNENFTTNSWVKELMNIIKTNYIK